MRIATATLAAVLATSLVAVPAFAGKSGPAPITTISKHNRDDNSVFVGLNWNFGAREGLTGVLGYRLADVDEHDDVRGAIFDVTFPITGAEIGLGELHVKALRGTDKVQGEAGLGFSFQRSALLINAGVRGPYSTAGVDYLIGGELMPYVGLTSLGATDDAKETTTVSCPEGFVLDGNSCFSILD